MKKFIKKTKRAFVASLVFVCILALGSPVLADVGLTVKTPMVTANQNIIYGDAKGSALGNLLLLQSNDTINKFTVDLSGNVTAAGKINNLTLTSNATGFSIAGGTAVKTLTLTGDATISGNPLSNPMTALGDIIYGGAAGASTRLAGAAGFLKSTGAAAPTWSTLTNGDVGLGNVENTKLSTWAGSANIITVGTITTGTWHGSVIATAYGGTGNANGTANVSGGSNGAVVYQTAANTTGVTAVGSSGQVLQSNGAGAPTWVSPSGMGGSGTTNYVPKFSAGTTLANSNIYDNGTNVGIGTISPTNGKLEVDSTVGTSIYGWNTTASGGYGVYGGTTGNGFGVYGYSASGDGVFGNGGTGYDFYGQGPKSYFAGNVGVGVVVPSYKLDVSGDMNIPANNALRTAGVWDLGTDAGNSLLSLGSQSTARNVGIYTNGATPTVYADTSGKVGIGTNSPGYQLDVESAGTAVYGKSSGYQLAGVYGNNTNSNNGYGVFGNNTTGSGYGVYGNSTGCSYAVYGKATMANSCSGNGVTGQTDAGYGVVGMADTGYGMSASTNSGYAAIQATNSSGHAAGVFNASSGEGIDVYNSSVTNPTVNVTNYSGGVGINVADNYANGWYTGWAVYLMGRGYLGDSSWHFGSDRRLKENIKYFDDTQLNALSYIKELRPASFDYINGAKNETGFVAQDVQPVLPDLVTADDKGMLSLKTDNLIPYLVKGMQEQQAQIEALQKDNQILQTQIDTLNSRSGQ